MSKADQDRRRIAALKRENKEKQRNMKLNTLVNGIVKGHVGYTGKVLPTHRLRAVAAWQLNQVKRNARKEKDNA